VSETLKVILLILLTVLAFIASFGFAGWKMRKASNFIIKDLKEKKAIDPASAVELPYSKSSLFHFGMKDYRPQALGALVKYDVVRLNENNRYYLRQEESPTPQG
jgi:hypothetical protein